MKAIIRLGALVLLIAGATVEPAAAADEPPRESHGWVIRLALDVRVL
jgi:hypothetical protein